jgi:hypothetical protein
VIKVCIANDYTSPLIENFVFDLEPGFTVTEVDAADFVFLELHENTDHVPVDFAGGIVVYDWFSAVSIGREMIRYVQGVQAKFPRARVRYISTVPGRCLPQRTRHAGIRFAHYDILWNRTKAYYQHWPFTALQQRDGEHPWLFAGQDAYRINLNLDQARPGDCASRMFVFATRCKSSNPARQEIADAVVPYADLGYFNVCHEPPPTQVPGLLTAQDDPLLNQSLRFDVSTATVVENTDKCESFFRGTEYYRGYSPIHVNYYSNSFCSIVVESVEDDTVVVTEKTWEALIHAHVPLIFGARGHMQELRDRGFRLVDFVDYSYDHIEPRQSRLEAFLKELRRLLAMPLEQWRESYQSNLAVLQHNQRLFWQRPFSELRPALEF